jgi:hypothetical protein
MVRLTKGTRAPSCTRDRQYDFNVPVPSLVHHRCRSTNGNLALGCRRKRASVCRTGARRIVGVKDGERCVEVNTRQTFSGLSAEWLGEMGGRGCGPVATPAMVCPQSTKTRQPTSAGVEPARSIPVAERVCFPRRRSLFKEPPSFVSRW